MRIYPNDASVRLTGRWDTSRADAAVTVNTGSYIEIAFEGRSALVLFDTYENASPALHLWISVDGGAMIETPIDAYLRINAADDGAHVAKIIYKGGLEASSRWYAPLRGKVTFLGVVADAPAILPDDKRPIIEFVGDSITEGVLVDEDFRKLRLFTHDVEHLNRPYQDDVCGTYAWLTAEALDMRPVIMGFGAVGALGDLFRVYFYNNIFLYSAVYENQAMGGAITIPPALIRLAFFAANFVVLAVLAFGLVRYVKCHRKTAVSPYLLLTFVGLQTAELLLLGYYSYYFLVLCVFLPLCLVPLVRRVAAKLEGKKPGRCGGLAIFACLVLAFTLLAGNNTRELFDGDKYAQTAVARRIAEEGKEDPSLLCYMMVDRGFYRAAGITPSTYYFAQNCYSEESYPEMYREYDRYVKEGVTDYVVAYAFDYEKDPALFDRYEKIGEYSYDFYDCNYSGYEVTYYLFRLR